MLWMWFNDEWSFHSFFVFLFLTKSGRDAEYRNTRRYSNILARFDPRPAGVHVEGLGCHNVSTQEYFFCPPSLLETVWLLCRDWMFRGEGGRVWSVTLVADWRELVLVIQTDGALGELVLWDDLTPLGSTILRVTWEEGKIYLAALFLMWVCDLKNFFFTYSLERMYRCVMLSLLTVDVISG